ncbi:MAG: hypothetical protein COV76_02730 [Candidatus Omnitrophica bacterium CG11_big_fil_rev_8_21_14_0_20_64_10]|nr:MAG: hypothetical protein COV76_02730 [Candidatus Omnitrophica bacterium CG11_big_fil_rev_8_21_14_0_20_64_10]
MFEKLKLIQKLMKDPGARELLSHPKVVKVLQDPEVQKAVKAENTGALIGHPKMMALMQDPELRELIQKVDFSSLL